MAGSAQITGRLRSGRQQNPFSILRSKRQYGKTRTASSHPVSGHSACASAPAQAES